MSPGSSLLRQIALSVSKRRLASIAPRRERFDAYERLSHPHRFILKFVAGSQLRHPNHSHLSSRPARDSSDRA